MLSSLFLLMCCDDPSQHDCQEHGVDHNSGGGVFLISVRLLALGELSAEQWDDPYSCPVISDCRTVAEA